MSHHSQIIAQTSINSCQIRPKFDDPQDHEQKLQVPCCSNFQKGKRSPRMRCDILCSHTIALFGNDAFIQFAKIEKNWIMILSSSMAMYSVMRDYTWYKKGTNGKRMSCSLLICHMQKIFKLIDFRTMGLWKWITFFYYAHYVGRI